MGADYGPAPQVAQLATGLIAEHHRHLDGIPIVYIARYPAALSKGRLTLGKARLVSGLNAFLANLAGGDRHGHPEFGHTFFVMEVAGYEWGELTDEARAALVDHELCHFGIDVDEDNVRTLWIRGHDVEEFIEVAQRHGAWSPELGALVGACS